MKTWPLRAAQVRAVQPSCSTRNAGVMTGQARAQRHRRSRTKLKSHAARLHTQTWRDEPALCAARHTHSSSQYVRTVLRALMSARVHAKPHELRGRGGVAATSGAHEHCLSMLIREVTVHGVRGSKISARRCGAARARGAPIANVRARAPFFALGSAPRRTSSVTVPVWPWRAALRSASSLHCNDQLTWGVQCAVRALERSHRHH